MGRTPQQRIRARIAFLQKQKDKYSIHKNTPAVIKTEEQIETLKEKLRQLEK